MRVARLFLFADWPEKYFSGQSEGGISNASGTRSVRVSAQGLSRSCCKLSSMKIPSSRLAAPGSPRMDCSVLRGELCFVFGSICAIIDRCSVLKENFASCLDRFVRLLDCSVLRGELCLVFGSICVSIDNYLVLRENITSWFAMDFV